ncbi:hypothetical protein ACKOUH_16145, partial [Legionella pneumophila]
ESFLTPLIESFPPPEFIILKKTIVGGSIFRQQRGSVYIQQRQFKAYKLFCNECGRYGNQQFPGIAKYQRSTERLQVQIFHHHTS